LKAWVIENKESAVRLDQLGSWPTRQARRSADRPCGRRSRRSFGRRHGPAASEGRPLHRRHHRRSIRDGIRRVDRTDHAVDAAPQNRERLPIARFRYCPAALPAEAARPAGQTERIPGPQFVGVAVNEGEPALQAFAVRQEPLASPLGHTKLGVHRVRYLRAGQDSVP
jgi:hypothetical protein